MRPEVVRGMELPPRARRIQSSVVEPRLVVGTTSACAENTLNKHRGGGVVWNYLRVRGEYHSPPKMVYRFSELPPRARRIRHRRVARGDNRGTTSACAENTDARYFCDATGWNYLRVRGEYVRWFGKIKMAKELPPRARRIPITAFNPVKLPGTTSACAENTPLLKAFFRIYRNYLRVRGEYCRAPA